MSKASKGLCTQETIHARGSTSGAKGQLRWGEHTMSEQERVPQQRLLAKSTAASRNLSGSPPVPGRATSCSTPHQFSVSVRACMHTTQQHMNIFPAPLYPPLPMTCAYLARQLKEDLTFGQGKLRRAPSLSSMHHDHYSTIGCKIRILQAKDNPVTPLRCMESGVSTSPCIAKIPLRVE